MSPRSTDLFLTHRSFDEMASDRIGLDIAIERGDIKLTSGRANLAQALISRLLTRRGELESLGHPDYGSRLYQLVGEPNSRHTQAIAELYIREALESEPRVREISAITFAPPSPRPDKRSTLEVTIAILPVEEEDQTLLVTTQIPL
jgi:phage baseplate assembly protein W